MHLARYDCFCVYQHVDPRTQEVRYIGMGTPARAYAINAHRTDKYTEWVEEIIAAGYSIWDIVQIKHKDLPSGVLDITRELVKM